MRAVTELTPEAWRRIGTVLDRVSDADSRTWNEALAHACEAEGVRMADVEPFLTALRRSGRFLEHLDPGILEECVRALAADDRPALAPGARLGAYEVIEALGAGGMGEVYKARDTRLSRLVAIKLVRVQIGQLAEARQRFEREARAISALNHPHICTLYDVGEHDSREFLVMELIEGETLAARLERGPLSIEETLRYGIQIADALASAHRQGIVHRDLKPSNVMLTPRGAKLLDFGLAALRAPQALSGDPDPTVTADGAVLGTVLYMAPEQLEGKSVDARADLFALGAILFEMLTGRRAYDADTTSIIKERLDAPPALDWAIRQCLVKTADQRWQNAADLATCLQWIAASPGTTDERPKTSSRRRMLIPFAVTIGAVLLASILFATRSRKTPVGEPVRYDIPPPEGTTYANMFALSADGRRIAFVAAAADATGGRALWIRPLDALSAQRIAGTENALYPFWSPDGTRIGFFADSKLKKVELATGNVQIICEAGLGGGGAWNAEDVILFSTQAAVPPAVLQRVSAAGGTATAITQRNARGLRGIHAWPEFLPDGRHYLYMRLEPEATSGVFAGDISTDQLTPIITRPLARGDPRRLTENLNDLVGRARYANGFLFYVRSHTLMAQPFDPRRLTTTGEAIRVADDVEENSPGRSSFDVAANGVLVYRTQSSNGTIQLTWFDRAGHPAGQVGDPGPFGSAALSPDGESVLADQQAGPIVRIDVTHGTATPVVNRGTLPVWSPDGSRFVYRGAPPVLSIAPTDGSEPAGHLLGVAVNAWPEDWSRDGRVIVGTAIRSETSSWDLFIDPVDAPRTIRFPVASRFDEADARLSPDGRWLAYSARDESTGWEVYVRPVEDVGGLVRVSRGGARYPRWGANGRELFYVAPDGTLMRVSIDSGPPFRVLSSAPLFRHHALTLSRGGLARSPYDVSPDGQRFLVMIPVEPPRSAPISVLLNWAGVLKH